MVTTPKHNCVPRCCMYSSEFRLPLKHAPLCSEGKFVGQLSGQGQCLEWAKRSQCVLQTNLRLNVPPPPLLHAPSSPPPPPPLFFFFFFFWTEVARSVSVVAFVSQFDTGTRRPIHQTEQPPHAASGRSLILRCNQTVSTGPLGQLRTAL